MKPLLHIRVVKFSILQEIDGAWSPADFQSLLGEMDYGDTTGLTDAELREMCLLSLQDLKPEEAAALVLSHRIGDHLKEGQIRNLSIEFRDEKFWEEYADMALHEQMFNVGSLLYAASQQACPEPDAVQVHLEIVAQNDPAKEILAHPLHESFLLRVLADGMEETATLRHLFDQQLAAESFPEADSIVWIVRPQPIVGHAIEVDVIGSGYWLDALRDTKSYDSTAWPDRVSDFESENADCSA